MPALGEIVIYLRFVCQQNMPGHGWWWWWWWEIVLCMPTKYVRSRVNESSTVLRFLQHVCLRLSCLSWSDLRQVLTKPVHKLCHRFLWTCIPPFQVTTNLLFHISLFIAYHSITLNINNDKFVDIDFCM